MVNVDDIVAAAPDLATDRAALRAHVSSLSDADAANADDIVLAFAAATGTKRAAERITEQHAEMIAHAIRGVRRDPTFVEEATQELYARLFVGSNGSPPRLLKYGGRGSLGGWLRVAATRLAIDLVRSERADVPLEDVLLPAESPSIADPDREVVRAALRAAIAAQPSRTRALLRFYYCDGMGVEELATMHGVHASTVSRWLAAMRESIVAETRDQLATRLVTSAVSSHLDLVHDLEVSLASLLATPRN
ncbi:MAG TPA: sigma-70 family RNA polymerase sigma factor [Kofleriaceae bacterium]|jgi:RNA polymerase sigma-70 factor (ECF subfamily)